MQKITKECINVVVPDSFYRVLYSTRFENNNCKSVRICKEGDKREMDCLTYDNGIELIYVAPESQRALFQFMTEKKE